MTNTAEQLEHARGIFVDKICAGGASIQLVLHNDGNTALGFVVRLLREVFDKQERDAIALAKLVLQQGKAVCGRYPPSVARALLEAAQERIRAEGCRLLITGEAAGDADGSDLSDVQFEYAFEALDWHFTNIPPSELATTVRQFPGHMQADVQVAIEELFADPVRFFGAYEEHRYETLSFARMKRRGRDAISLVPPQYHQVDTGDTAPVKCLYNGLWLCRANEFLYAVVLSTEFEFKQEAKIRIEIVAPAGSSGEAFVQRSFDELERAVHAARSYRGKILSFEKGADYSGRSRGIMVHRLAPVRREDVILREQAIKLLDRNVLSFVATRDALRRFGQSTRKGILLYGPPGTGKTHTIRYLATNLPGHTTLIITAEEVGELSAYMALARLLQPTMVVIEDVDLIASKRDQLATCEEAALNKLLNEMDGLKQDADILFVLTTNRPEQLEGALAGRPGRIDQAIEMPLPDTTGRDKLIRLYGMGLPLEAEIVAETVRRTEGISAAFIKELMRRIAQSCIARDGGNSVTTADIEEALDDMLFTGGRLNVKLLGGAGAMAAGSE
ncbi:ATP-dependent Clp protease adaptor ClpS [Bradyrhizobium lupini]|uniref:ATP-dependent Clp protease adaptor ClpS n=1 Tax=Rhizobium lupini TaxID=136996 RepID=UPI00366BC1DD